MEERSVTSRGVYREGVCPALEVPQQRPGAVDRPPPRGADVIGDVLREVAVRVENALASGFRLPVAVRVRFPPAGTRPRDVRRVARVQIRRAEYLRGQVDAADPELDLHEPLAVMAVEVDGRWKKWRQFNSRAASVVTRDRPWSEP